MSELAMKAAFEQADQMVAMYRAVNPEAAIAQAGISPVLSSLGIAQDRAGEQYESFKDHVHTAVRPIAQSIAGQRVCLARASRSQPGGPQRRTVPHEKVPKFARTVKGLDTVLSEVEHHPFLDAINDPNELMVSWALMYSTAVSLMLTGRSYWWFYLDPKEKRYHIWPIPTHWMTPRSKGNRLYADYLFRIPQQQADSVVIPGEEVVPFFIPNAGDPRDAFSTLQAASGAVVCDQSIMKGQVAAFRNGIRPGLAVIAGDQKDPNNEKGRARLNKFQRRQIIDEIKGRFRGSLRDGEPIILDAVVRDIKPVTTSPREMDFLNSGIAVQSRILEAFGTSRFIVGSSENGNRAQAVAAEHHFNDFTINPLIEFLSQVMTKWIGPRFAKKNETLVVYIEPRETDDPDTKRNDLKFLGSGGALTVNEARRAYGLADIPGGDVRFMTNNMVFRSPDDEALDSVDQLGGGGEGGSVNPVAEGQPPREDHNGINAERRSTRPRKKQAA